MLERLTYQVTRGPEYETTVYDEVFCRWCECELEAERHADWCKGNGNVDWALLRLFVLYRDGDACRYCGAKAARFSPLHVDHVIPKSRGGINAMWNLVTACASCNAIKGARIFAWTIDWERRRAMVEAAREYEYLTRELIA